MGLVDVHFAGCIIETLTPVIRAHMLRILMHDRTSTSNAVASKVFYDVPDCADCGVRQDLIDMRLGLSRYLVANLG